MTHEELVEVADLLVDFSTSTRMGRAVYSRAILALIAERLKEPTKAMLEAAWEYPNTPWSAMLAASPLVPPRAS